MAERVTKGFIGGHAATRGWYAGGSEPIIEAILSEMESHVGLTPLLRVRFDLDGDGIYEVVELDKIKSVGNLTRTIEYVFSRPRFGSCQVDLANCDQRFSDNYPHALTKLDPANPSRYFMRRVIIELGFDDVHKHQDEYWLPIFMGLITEKTESAANRSVQFGLMDEWTQLLNYPLAPALRADQFLKYVSVADPRTVQLGTYFGRQLFLTREYLQKDKQLLIPCCINTAGPAKGGSAETQYDAFKLYTPQALNLQLIKTEISSSNTEVYFWGWDKTWDESQDVKQWLKLLPTLEDGTPVYSITDLGEIAFLLPVATEVRFETVRATIIEKSLASYFDVNNKEYDPDVRISVNALEDNPIKILYSILRSMVGIPFSFMDASNDDPEQWLQLDYDYDNPNYFSFDVSSKYLELQGAKVCVRAEDNENVIDLINSFCTLSRGSFFIDKGRSVVDHVPNRRLHFVIHQPRLAPTVLKTLDESRLISPEITRSIQDIRNVIHVGSFAYSGLLTAYSDLEQYTVKDTGSIGVYGERAENILYRPGSTVFLDDCLTYARFLGEHILMLYKEPPLTLNFSSGLIGLHFDLKSLLGIKERSSLNVDFVPGVNTGVYEIYSVGFNTNSYEIKFSAQWAGYLISPDGSAGKGWGYWNHFHYGSEDGYYW